MPWNDPYETFVGSSGQAYTSPVGTAFPTGFAEPGAAWSGLGYASEDGVAQNHEFATEDLGAWQAFGPIRRIKTGETFTLGLALLQWNEVNVPLAFGGGEVATITGGYEYTPPDSDDALEEKAVLADIFDGERQLRILMKRATIEGAVENAFTRSSFAELPITLAGLQPEDGSPLYGIRFSDSAAFAAGS